MTDNGSGIPADARELVFEPFFSSKRSSGGTGLGLAIARRIVADHGGEIRIEDPETRGDAVRRRAAPRGDAAELARVARVLIAEDEAELAQTLADVLRGAGHEVRTTANGDEALALARELCPELVISDWMLGTWTDGVTLIDSLRAATPAARGDPDDRLPVRAAARLGRPEAGPRLPREALLAVGLPGARRSGARVQGTGLRFQIAVGVLAHRAVAREVAHARHVQRPRAGPSRRARRSRARPAPACRRRTRSRRARTSGRRAGARRGAARTAAARRARSGRSRIASSTRAIARRLRDERAAGRSAPRARSSATSVGAQPEDVHVLGADRVAHLDRGAVERADRERAVQRELHVAGARTPPGPRSRSAPRDPRPG